MALGDMATGVTASGTLQIAVTYTCPNCQTVNTTPAVNRPIVQGSFATTYGVSVCSNCAKRMLIDLSAEALFINVQQTS